MTVLNADRGGARAWWRARGPVWLFVVAVVVAVGGPLITVEFSSAVPEGPRAPSHGVPVPRICQPPCPGMTGARDPPRGLGAE